MDAEVWKCLYRMNAAELVMWVAIGGDIPPAHPEALKAQGMIAALGKENGTQAEYPPRRKIVTPAVARRKVG